MTSCVSLSLREVREPERKVFELFNDFRTSKGLPRLKYLKRRQWEVDVWAKHISKRFEHAKTGYTSENIAYNYEKPRGVVLPMEKFRRGTADMAQLGYPMMGFGTLACSGVTLQSIEKLLLSGAP